MFQSLLDSQIQCNWQLGAKMTVYPNPRKICQVNDRFQYELLKSGEDQINLFFLLRQSLLVHFNYTYKLSRSQS
jgi:hypothetical protein